MFAAVLATSDAPSATFDGDTINSYRQKNAMADFTSDGGEIGSKIGAVMREILICGAFVSTILCVATTKTAAPGVMPTNLGDL